MMMGFMPQFYDQGDQEMSYTQHMDDDGITMQALPEAVNNDDQEEDTASAAEAMSVIEPSVVGMCPACTSCDDNMIEVDGNALALIKAQVVRVRLSVKTENITARPLLPDIIVGNVSAEWAGNRSEVMHGVIREASMRAQLVLATLNTPIVTDIAVTKITLLPQTIYFGGTNLLAGYSATIGISFSTMAEFASRLIRQAAAIGLVEIDSIEYSANVTDVQQARKHAVHAATIDAMKQAKTLADTLRVGTSHKRLHIMSTKVSYITNGTHCCVPLSSCAWLLLCRVAACTG